MTLHNREIKILRLKLNGNFIDFSFSTLDFSSGISISNIISLLCQTLLGLGFTCNVSCSSVKMTDSVYARGLSKETTDVTALLGASFILWVREKLFRGIWKGPQQREGKQQVGHGQD